MRRKSTATRQAHGSVTMPSNETTMTPASQASFTAPLRAVGEAALMTMAFVALEHEVLDLGGLLGRLVLGRRERIGRGDDAGLHRLGGDLLPALQHRLPPGIAA